mgnify:CR=1 FL=1|tara:strand:+ start:647 stop:1444 length:798 start_codon:yes stop_codon:yes gene_type:complete
MKKYIPEKFKSGKIGDLYRKLFQPENTLVADMTFESSSNQDYLDYLIENHSYKGRLGEIYSESSGMQVSKWAHYIPAYDKLFEDFLNKPDLKFLEIGVCKGGSLHMWRKYFGKNACIYGIDIDEECLKFTNDGKVRIGSQTDTKFLDSIIDEMGGVDIILDDGSHLMNDIKHTFLHLFPKMNENGLYVVEDLHCAFWGTYGGGYNSKDNFFKFTQDLTKDIHHWYHNKPVMFPSISSNLSSIKIYDSIVAFEKKKVVKPTLFRKI